MKPCQESIGINNAVIKCTSSTSISEEILHIRVLRGITLVSIKLF